MANTSQPQSEKPAPGLADTLAQFMLNPAPRYWNIGSFLERVREVKQDSVASEIDQIVNGGVISEWIDWRATPINDVASSYVAWVKAAETLAHGIMSRGSPSDFDARADAAAIVFCTVVNALWQTVDAVRSESINDFLDKLSALREPIVSMYGPETKDMLNRLSWICNSNATLVHTHLQPKTGKPGPALCITSAPPFILDFFVSSAREREHCTALNRFYERVHRKTASQITNQEKLLADARAWAEPVVRELVMDGLALTDVQAGVAKRTWDEFIAKRRDEEDFQLDYIQFTSALWVEGEPPLEELARSLILEREADRPLTSATTATKRLERDYPLSAEAKARYEQDWANAYRTFYSELDDLGKLTMAQAISHTPFNHAVKNIGRPLTADPKPAPRSPFEEVLFQLYKGLLIAYRQLLEDSGLPPSVTIQRIRMKAEVTHREIYRTKLQEFAERAGFYAERAIPEPLLLLLTVNSRDQILMFLQNLEREVLDRAETPRQASVIGVIGGGRDAHTRAGDISLLRRPGPSEPAASTNTGAVSPTPEGERGMGTEQSIPSAVDCEFNVTTRPLLWSRFRFDRCFKESAILNLIPDTHVSLTTPASHSNRDLIIKLAAKAEISIDLLADELNRPTFSRGQTIFGYAGDEVDEVAKNYANMRWWVSERGLVLSVLTPEEILQDRTDLNTTVPVTENGEDQVLRRANRGDSRRGRQRNDKRREAIRQALLKHERWREHFLDVLGDLDAQKVFLGDFAGRRIDLGDGKHYVVQKWEDLDLALGQDRRKILDAFRKYLK